VPNHTCGCSWQVTPSINELRKGPPSGPSLAQLGFQCTTPWNI
jgi:hypothetical protein